MYSVVIGIQFYIMFIEILYEDANCQRLYCFLVTIQVQDKILDC